VRGVRRATTLDGVEYAPNAKFRVVKAGCSLHGMVPIRGGMQGWRVNLEVGDVIECTGFGAGWGSDPGYGVEWTSEQCRAVTASHVEFSHQIGGIWSYRPQPGWLEPL
jgi:hypothetical protein